MDDLKHNQLVQAIRSALPATAEYGGKTWDEWALEIAGAVEEVDAWEWDQCGTCGGNIFMYVGGWSHEGGTPPQDHEAMPKPFPQSPADARKCVHGMMVWFGHECGVCMDAFGEFVWADA